VGDLEMEEGVEWGLGKDSSIRESIIT